MSDLPETAREVLLDGDEEGFPGVVPYLRRRVERLLHLDPSPSDEEGHDGGEAFDDLRPYLTEEACRPCRGTRLRPESLAVQVSGTVPGGPRPAVARAGAGGPRRPRVRGARAPRRRATRGRDASGVSTCSSRSASATSPSTGPRPRSPGARLTASVWPPRSGRGMQGLLYVLDEPSVGLHQRDNARLIETLRSIRDAGNTVVVVEHDEETIRAADWVVDLGEGAGARGGRLMYAGPPDSMDGSLTGRYLRGELKIPVPAIRRESERSLRILGARARNLRDIDVDHPPRGAHRGDRGLRRGQVHPGRGGAAPGPRPAALPCRGRAGAAPDDRGRRGDRQGRGHRPEPHRAHAAVEPGHLHRRLRLRPGDVQPRARGPGPGLPARPFLLQRQGGPLRGLPGRRGAPGGDALPARCLRPVRGLPRAALQPGDAGDPATRAAASPTCWT